MNNGNVFAVIKVNDLSKIRKITCKQADTTENIVFSCLQDYETTNI